MDRRQFLVAGATLTLARCAPAQASARLSARPHAHPQFQISLAEWSLHRTIRAGDLDPLDFAPFTRATFGLDAVEHVNQFFIDRGGDDAYFREMRRRADDAGVRSLLIMCDLEGALGAADEGDRLRAVENHRKWLDAAALLGCHSIRVNAESEGPRDQQLRLAADGLRRLCEVAEPYGLNVLVENHGGLSSDGAWLADVMRRVDHPLIGTLPDFGNFTIAPGEEYDRYEGVRQLMPWARAVSAKSYAFDEHGREMTIDYERMMRIVRDAGYDGYIGIEYEGDRLSEEAGVRATMMLLRRMAFNHERS